MPSEVDCPHCGGTGRDPRAVDPRCFFCSGRGTVKAWIPIWDRHPVTAAHASLIDDALKAEDLVGLDGVNGLEDFVRDRNRAAQQPG